MAAFFQQDSRYADFFNPASWSGQMFTEDKSYGPFFANTSKFGTFFKKEQPEGKLAEPGPITSKPTTHEGTVESKLEQPIPAGGPVVQPSSKTNAMKSSPLSVTSGSVTRPVHRTPSAPPLDRVETASTNYIPSDRSETASSGGESRRSSVQHEAPIVISPSDKKHETDSKTTETKTEQPKKQTEEASSQTEKKSDLPKEFAIVGNSIRIGEVLPPRESHGILTKDEKTGTLKGYRSFTAFIKVYKAAYHSTFRGPSGPTVGQIGTPPEGNKIMFVPRDVAMKFDGHKID